MLGSVSQPISVSHHKLYTTTQLDISLATVHHWKQEENPQDRSCRPHTIHYALEDPEEALVLWLRGAGHLSLDDLLEATQDEHKHLGNLYASG